MGFLVGIGFLLLLDNVTPHMHMDEQTEGPRSSLKPQEAEHRRDGRGLCRRREGCGA